MKRNIVFQDPPPNQGFCLKRVMLKWPLQHTIVVFGTHPVRLHANGQEGISVISDVDLEYSTPVYQILEVKTPPKVD